MLEAYDFRSGVREEAVLTGSYVAATSQETKTWHNQLIIYYSFTKGSLSSSELKVEFSNDNSTWYRETSSSLSSGTSTDDVVEHTFDSTGNFRIPIAIKDRYVRVSVKGTGTVTSSLASIDLVLGTV